MRAHILLVSFAICLLAFSVGAAAQTISQPQPTLPVQSYSDDPLITGSSYSAALCSLHNILGTESGAHGIGPLTPQAGCMSMTLQTRTSSVNGQSLPSSGIATVFSTSSTASSTSLSSPSSSSRSLSLTSTMSTGGGSTTTAAPRQTNAGQTQKSPPAVAVAIAKYNIGLLLFTGFALLAGVTYFLDELLGYLL